MATAQPDLDALKKGQSRLKLLRRPALRRRGVEGGVEDLVKSQALIKRKTNRVGWPEILAVARRNGLSGMFRGRRQTWNFFKTRCICPCMGWMGVIVTCYHWQ
jgi:hypothetical protein